MNNESRKAAIQSEARPIIDVFNALNGAAISVHQERCAKVRNRNVACLKCAKACTSGCISIQDGKLCIDTSLCVGCGTCATMCPTNALQAHAPSDDVLFSACRSSATDGQVLIACELALQAAGSLIDTEKIVSVTCLGRVDESLLLRLCASGVHGVSLVCGDCDHCAQKAGRNTTCMVCESTQALLDAWGASFELSEGPLFPERVLARGATSTDCAHARKAFFSELRANNPVPPISAEQGATPAEKEAPFSLHVMRDGTLPHFLPNRRERLLDALSRLGEPKADTLETRLWGWVVIDGTKCVSCQMCATFCPTGALAKFEEEDGTFGVYHYPADCVKCGSCQDICPAGAITIMDTIRTDYLLSGKSHRYAMKPRATLQNDAHQILSHMKHQLKGTHIFER